MCLRVNIDEDNPTKEGNSSRRTQSLNPEIVVAKISVSENTFACTADCRRSSDKLKRIGSTPFPADMPAGENQNHTIRIVVRGSEFQFYFNGARVFSAFDDSLKNGGVGLRTWGNVEVVFRDVVVNEL